MKVTPTVFLALMAASGVISGPLQKRAEVTTTTTQTVLTTVTVDGPGDIPTEAATTSEIPATTPTSEPTVETTPEETTPVEETTEEPTVEEPTTEETTVEEPTTEEPTVEEPTTEEPTVEEPTTQEPTVEEPATEEPTTEESTTSSSDSSSDSTTTNAGTSSSPDSSSTDPVIAAALRHHNIHRANHSSPDVAWAEDIAGYAAITAATCTFAHDTATGGGGYGQNIAMWASSGDVRATGAGIFMGRTISEMWYNGEINLFPASDYGKDSPDMSNFHAWGHYTQVIWGETTSVGCAVQYCEPGTMVDGMGAYYSVCNYYPPGNMGGAYGENVLPPQGASTFHAS